MLGAYLNKLDFWVADGNVILSKGSMLSTSHLNITCKQQQSENNRDDFREDLLKPFITHLTSVLGKLCCEPVEGLDPEAREMAQWAMCLPHKCEDLRLTLQIQQKLDVALQVSVISTEIWEAGTRDPLGARGQASPAHSREKTNSKH